jgi:predicted ATPase
MKIELTNIGMLESATVKLNGLTIIAGENDTAKSTVGKILFCIMKAIGRYDKDFQESKKHKISEILERLFFYSRKISDLELTDFEELQFTFSLNNYYRNRDNVDGYIKDINGYVKSINNQPTEVKDNLKVDLLLEQLESTIKEPENKQKSIENALNKVFRSEFNSNILNINKEKGYIRLFENNLLLLDITINNDNRVTLESTVQPIEITEATFIETPLILNNHDLLIRSQTGLDITKKSSKRLGIPYTTLHTKDLFDKLKSFNFDSYPDLELQNTIKNDITAIINGEILYDDDEKDFVYIKSGKKIPIKNTATGIKAFGIIQLLLESGFINRTSILILDEPEIHLHPKWQLLYAKVITVLAKNEIPILVTSHSPYMIEALKRYSDNYNLEKITNFYLSSENTIQDENKLEDIFRVLSEPFETFREMDAKRLRDE